MKYEELKEFLAKAAKHSEGMAILRGSKDRLTIIIFQNGHEERVQLERSSITYSVAGDNGIKAFSGTWQIPEDASFQAEQEENGTLIFSESGLYPEFEVSIPYAIEDSPDGRRTESETLDIYTDGSCRIKRGQKTGHGAWAFVCVRNGGIVASASNYVPKTTSHDMELMAITYALKTARKMDAPEIIIHSDSKNIIEMANLGFDPGNPPSCYDRDLWTRFTGMLASVSIPVYWHWVRGHSGDRWNEEVNAQVQAITGRKVKTTIKKKQGKTRSTHA